MQPSQVKEQVQSLTGVHAPLCIQHQQRKSRRATKPTLKMTGGLRASEPIESREQGGDTPASLPILVNPLSFCLAGKSSRPADALCRKGGVNTIGGIILRTFVQVAVESQSLRAARSSPFLQLSPHSPHRPQYAVLLAFAVPTGYSLTHTPRIHPTRPSQSSLAGYEQARRLPLPLNVQPQAFPPHLSPLIRTNPLCASFFFGPRNKLARQLLLPSTSPFLSCSSISVKAPRYRLPSINISSACTPSPIIQLVPRSSFPTSLPSTLAHIAPPHLQLRLATPPTLIHCSTMMY